MLARTHARIFAAIAAVAVTLSFMAYPLQAYAQLNFILIAVAPNQTVERITDRDGQDAGPGVFEAEIRGYDNGLANGEAMLRLENSRYDFYFQRVELKATDEITITTPIDVRGHGQRTDARGRKDAFTFEATVQPHQGGTDIPPCLIWDLDGANASNRESFRFHFEAEATLRLLER